MKLINKNNNIEPGKRTTLVSRIKRVLIMCWIVLVSCAGNSDEDRVMEKPLFSKPLFKNSIVSTDIDFITDDDPSTFTSIKYIGQKEREMLDRRNDRLMDASTFVFEASFSDENNVKIWAHSSFGTVAEAEQYAQMLSEPLGKLPEVMRKVLRHVMVHKGYETAFGESEGHFFVLYSENMKTRIRNHDLEETVFHESVHATLESTYKNDARWLKAQKDDGAFITEYAEQLPALEDLPETAIFAYTMIHNTGRLSADIEKWVHTYIPNRLAFFKTIYD